MHGMIQGATMDALSDSNLFDGSQSPINESWYALLVCAGRERQICRWLCRRQYRPYWPRHEAMVKRNGSRWMKGWKSIIVGYLFLPSVGPVNWRLIEECPGIRGVMRDVHRQPVIIPEFGENGMERIRELEETAKKDFKLIEKGIPFGEGQKVTIKGKSWENEGVITRVVSKNKCLVRTHFFGADREIELSFGVLEAIYED